MFEGQSLLTRVAIGKLVGFLIGLTGFLAMPYFWPDAEPMLRWGILFWYTTLGAIIGMFGVFTWHPVLRLPMPWWVRATVLGAWMNFVLVLFSYDTMQVLLILLFGEQSILASPFWFVIEGAFVGFIIGFFATRFGGEGADVSIPVRPNA